MMYLERISNDDDQLRICRLDKKMIWLEYNEDTIGDNKDWIEKIQDHLSDGWLESEEIITLNQFIIKSNWLFDNRFEEFYSILSSILTSAKERGWFE